MAAPTLSVALPNFNHGRYLPESLGAICEQSHKPKEVVVVDDCSTDESLEILEGFARRYPFVKLLRNPKNMGAMATANRAISECTADFVICPASDDKLRPGLFEKTAAVLSEHPGAGVCSALCWMLGENGEELGPFHTPIISEEPCFIPPERFQEMNKKHGNWILSQTAFYNRKGLQEFGGGFDPELGSAADSFLVYVLGAKYGSCFIPERLGNWRKLDESFALRSAADNVEGAAKLLDLLDTKMRGAKLFDEDFLERSKRAGLMATLYEINRRRPYRFDGIALLGAGLLKRTWTDRLFFAWLDLLKLIGHWSSKLYLFLYQPRRERRRIALGRIKKILAGG